MIEYIVSVTIIVLLFCILNSKIVSEKRFEEATNVKLENLNDMHMTENSAKDVLKSLHKCKDLHWFNILIKRFWYELANSKSQSYRLKIWMQKFIKTVPYTKIIKSINVTDVNLGVNNPIVKSIQIVSATDLVNILHKKKILVSNKNLIQYKTKNDKIDVNKVYEDIYKNLHIIGSLEFLGSITINLKIEFPKNIMLNTKVIIHEVKGDILVKFPSLSYNTKFDYAFLHTPEIRMEIDAGLSRGEGEKYFKHIISSFLQKTIKYAFIKNLLHPAFNTLSIPLIVPGFKSIKHEFKKITATNSSELKKIEEMLLFYMSIDYKVLERKNTIVFSSSDLLLNNIQKICCARFKLTSSFINSKDGCNKKLNEEKSLLHTENSNILDQIYDLSILKHVISAFKQARTIHTFNNTASLVEAEFNKDLIEFVRIKQQDAIFLQRNDEKHPEFIIFRLKNNEMYLYDFTMSRNLKLTTQRILKLRNKLVNKHHKMSKFTKILSFSKNAFRFWKFGTASTKNNNKDVCIQQTTEEQFDLDTEKIDNSENNIPSELKLQHKFTCQANIIFDILLNDTIRFRFLSESAKVISVAHDHESYKKFEILTSDTSHKIYTAHSYFTNNTICDYFEGKKVFYEIKEVIIKKRIETKYIAEKAFDCNSSHFNSTSNLHKNKKITFLDDTKLNNNQQNLSRFDNKRESKIYDTEKIGKHEKQIESILNIYTSQDFTSTSVSSLYESIITRITHQKVITLGSQSQFERLELNKEFRKDFFGDSGGVYLEFRTEFPDDFKLTLFSTTFKKNLLEINKIITSRPVKIIIPVTKADILLLKLTAKFRKNKTIDIKVVNLPIEYHKESLLDCNIGLSKKEKFVFTIMGSTDNIIFWEKEYSENILGSLENSITKVPIVKNGAMRAEKLLYYVVYRNIATRCRDIRIYMGTTKKN